MSRIEQGRLRLEQASLDLTALVQKTVATLEEMAPHQLIVLATEQPCWVDGDALRLE